MKFIKLLRIALAASACICGLEASASTYPSGPIRLVVPLAAGGGTDTVARLIAQKLGQRLGQPVVVDNRPGAGGAIGTVAVARARPDGQTLLFGSNGPIAILPSFDPSVPYNVSKDFVAVSGVASVPFLIVTNKDLPIKSMSDLLKYAKDHPGQVNFASPGAGTTNHLVGELLKSLTGVDIVHVPYKGASPAMNDVVSGQIQFMSGDLNTLLPMVESGKLNAIAVTSKQRTQMLPKVPTVAESGVPNFEASGWFGVLAPRGTPDAVVKKLSAEIHSIVNERDFVERIASLGGVPLELGNSDFAAFIGREQGKWRSVVTKNRIAKE
ncbi:tripartite tricarboxylate transporter substrate binding protein [Cupriavidus sp. SW-Y-13]|uniref:Bug family tripartite tricarboxylate transporter substrate binding protein n=1 Tax=Cupriavidus sp. SW-Y-13 TaxID=2653854 RepID=UPI0013652364|nr:tripartite tricarboxylate transporter substrate binding protein [Cupriavidus sp. SW-Y-13]MWL91529.1 tripartite tricarboxylate transporter substrate binding protein [Cupriavidus sp. SW-Y-13]